MKIQKFTEEQLMEFVQCVHDMRDFVEMAEAGGEEWEEDFKDRNPFWIRQRRQESREWPSEAMMVARDVVAKILDYNWSVLIITAETLINNCCDPDSDTLEWKPEVVKALEAYEKQQATKQDEPPGGNTPSWYAVPEPPAQQLVASP